MARDNHSNPDSEIETEEEQPESKQDDAQQTSNSSEEQNQESWLKGFLRKLFGGKEQEETVSGNEREGYKVTIKGGGPNPLGMMQDLMKQIQDQKTPQKPIKEIDEEARKQVAELIKGGFLKNIEGLENKSETQTSLPSPDLPEAQDKENQGPQR